MVSRRLLGVILLLSILSSAGWAEDEVFSGPQVGEPLPPFKAVGVLGELAGEEFDPIQQADGKPVALIFVHARTRPAFGLTNTVMKFAAQRSEQGLQTGVIFLTDDATATKEWMQNVKRHFPEQAAYGISMDGLSGPGAYGLNRKVTLTVLVGKGRETSANFALVQPSIQADAPKILKAIAEVTGGGKVPTLAELRPARNANRGRMNMRTDDPRLARLVRAVINKQATDEQVRVSAAEVESYCEKNDKAAKQLGQIAGRIVNSDKLANYGTEAAQTVIRGWAKKYGKKN